jgi:hypothetical protein
VCVCVCVCVCVRECKLPAVGEIRALCDWVKGQAKIRTQGLVCDHSQAQIVTRAMAQAVTRVRIQHVISVRVRMSVCD